MSRASFLVRKAIHQAKTASDNYHFHVLPNCAGPMHKRILDCMKYADSFTICELAQLLKIDKSTISARRSELLETKQIEYGSDRKCKCGCKNKITKTGVLCQTVRLPMGEL